jgi:dihydropteroate synthase
MAILNLTPDSFSGDGVSGIDAALRHAQRAVDEGAEILDLGGESSRPGALPVSEQEELDRVMPVLERLVSWPVPVSVDTVRPALMRAAIAAGVAMVNDINAFAAEGALDAVADSSVALCVMHMRGAPRTMQADPVYQDVVAEVRGYLAGRVDVLRGRGVAPSRIVLDPGFGFGKTLEHNLALLRGLPSLLEEGYPVLAGLSRKSMLGQITGRPVSERATASAVAALLAAQFGARILRVHDVGATRDALRLLEAVQAHAVG